MPAWLPVKPKTTVRWWARKKSCAGREMHWIRIDRYFKASQTIPKPIISRFPACNAKTRLANWFVPSVLPVIAMKGSTTWRTIAVSARAIVLNNCPYKVRRFNFFLYSDFDTESVKLSRNPDVTVRSRGVMEKCTYCVQRINQAKIGAEKEDRKLRDGEDRHRLPASLSNSGDRLWRYQ
jgi:molybdopterin-containing oxidoreductase family iron-sulfur binding subunit